MTTLGGQAELAWTQHVAAFRRTLALAVALLVVLPAAALAHPQAQPLVDQTPLTTVFKDRVTTSNPRIARLSTDSGQWFTYTAPDGTVIPVSISPQYGGNVSPTVAQSYVDFLDSLDHGPELARLRIYIAPPAEVQQACGGQQGTLACYDSPTQIMTVPGEELQLGDTGVTTSYVVAHEYGHHIAAFRNNTPFRAFAFGPKYWASYELVCDRTGAGLLAPGNEDVYYLANPGEAWAETYAQLKYPNVDWQYTPLLKPDAGAFAAARQDVLQPWHGQTTEVFKSSFGKTGRSTRTFSFRQHLDGALSVKLKGPRGTNYDFRAYSGGYSGHMTTSPRSNDSASYTAVCRETAVQTVHVTVKRVTGSGPFTLRVTYPG